MNRNTANVSRIFLLLTGILFIASSVTAMTNRHLQDARYHVFEVPLVAFSTPTPSQTQRLQNAVHEYAKAGRPTNLYVLSHYLSHAKHSPWRASLLLNMALVKKHAGYFSEALALLKQSRMDSASGKTRAQKAVYVKATGELLDLYTRFGRPKALQRILNTIKRSPATASISEEMYRARTGLWQMQHQPQFALRCGIVALETLLGTKETSLAHAFDKQVAGKHGTTLTQLIALAKKENVATVAIHRRDDQPIPVPSVMHLRVGHYATILRHKGDFYQVQDPAMESRFWMSKDAINAEASGHFLVLKSTFHAHHWQQLAAAEAGQVIGGGNTAHSQKGMTSTDEIRECNNQCGSHGMPQYHVYSMAVGLNLEDTPDAYTPPVGPAVPIRLEYSQREDFQPATFTYFNLGQKWNFNWLSYVTDDPQSPGYRVSIYLPGGGTRFYGGYNSATGMFTMEQHTGAHVIRRSSPTIEYERDMPNGSKYIYAQSDNNTYYPRRIFLTQVIDSAGNAVTLSYDAQLRLSTLTDAIGQVTTFHYANTAYPLQITSVTDPFGRTVSFTYDDTGRLASITDVLGLTSSFNYDSGTFINAMTTAYGTTHFSYGEAGTTRWVEITDPKGEKDRVEYRHSAPGIPFSDTPAPTGMNLFNDYISSRNTFYWDKEAMKRAPGDYTQARIRHWYHLRTDTSTTTAVEESTKNPLERRTWYNYPGQGWGGADGTLDKPSIIGRVLPDGSTQLTHMQYNNYGKLTDLIDPNGRELVLEYAANQIDLLRIKRKTATGYDVIAAFTYNNQHRMLSYTDADGNVTTYTYNAKGERTSVTNALGQTTQYNYNDQGYLVGVLDPNNNTVATLTYDAVGRIASITDAAGYTREFSYDNLNRLVHITYPDGTSDSIAWDKLDVASKEDRYGDVTKYAHDAVRRLISLEDPSNHTTTYGYFANGKLASILDAKGNASQIVRDIQGRITSKIAADGTHTDYVYDNNGRLDHTVDANGGITQYAYLHDNRLGSVTDPNGNTTSYKYDPYTGFRVEQDSPDSGTTTFAYDANGNVIAKTDAKGQTTQYSYDALNRIKTKIYADGQSVAYFYDEGANGIGHLSRVVDTSGITSYTYDARGKVISRTQTDNAGHSYTLNYAYTVSGLLSQITYPSGNTVNYHYIHDRLSDVDVNGQSILNNIQYAPFGGVTGWTWGNGQANTWAYDADNLLTQFSVGTQSRQLSYDKVGDVTAASGAGVNTQYLYDNLWRLTAANDPSYNLDFSYDTNGNRTTSSDGGVTTTYGIVAGTNRINTVNSIAYQYDADGNVINDGRHTYGYDARNRLVSVDGTAATYSYNAFGQRVGKHAEQSYVLTADLNHDGVIDEQDIHVLQDMIKAKQSPPEADLNQDGVVDQHDIHCIANAIQGQTASNGTNTSASDCHVGETITHETDTHFVYQGSKLLGEYDSHGNVKQEIVWMGNIPIAVVQDGQIYQISVNQLGAPVAITNAAGTVVWNWEPRAFGHAAPNEDPDGNGAKFVFNLRFPGQYYDQESGLYYNNFRYYDPSTGRYISSDPIGLAGGLNTYGYVGGNPISFYDPYGLAWQISLGISGTVIVPGFGITLAANVGINFDGWNSSLFGRVEADTGLGAGAFVGYGINGGIAHGEDPKTGVDVSNYVEGDVGAGLDIGAGAAFDKCGKIVSSGGFHALGKIGEGAGLGAFVGKSYAATYNAPIFVRHP